MPLLLSGIVLGICTITFCPESLKIIFCIAAIIILLCAVFVKQMRKARFKTVCAAIVFLLAMGVTSLAYMRVESREIFSQDSLIEGRICMQTECDENGVVITGKDKTVYLDSLKVDGREFDGIAETVFVDGSLLDGLKIGDTVKFKADISSTNLVVTDAYSVSKHINKIYYRVYCREKIGDVDRVFSKIGERIKIIERIKLKVKSVLYSNVGSDTAGFLYAMTFGDKSGLDETVKSNFASTGTAHVFAVSGLHVGIISGALLLILRKLRINNSVVRLIVLAAFLIPYCALCGFSASTVRASVMTLVAMTARLLTYRSDALSNMSIAGCAILLIEPIDLFNLGFLLSFLAIFGLIMLSSPLARIFAKIMPKKLASVLSSTVAVNISILPIMTLFFGGQSLSCLIANLAVLPIVGVTFPIYLFVAALCALLPFAGVLMKAAGAPFALMIRLVGGISEIKSPIVYFESGIFLILFGIFSVVFLSEYFFVADKAKKISAAVLSVCFCISVAVNSRSLNSEYLTVYCFEDKYECQYVLLDNAGGGSYLVLNSRLSGDTAEAVAAFMKKKGFSSLDGIITVGDGMSENAVRSLAEKTGASLICSYDPFRYGDSFAQCSDYLSESNFDVYFTAAGNLKIVAADTKIAVIADGYYSSGEECDILVSYSPCDDPFAAQYIVCGSGYTNSLQNYLPPTFTFRLKNGRILMNPSWRY